MLDASDAALMRALPEHGAAAAAIISARRLLQVGLSETLLGCPVDVSDPALQEYLITRLQNYREERLHVIFADAAGNFITDETIAVGSIDQLSVSVRSIMECVFDCGARAILLAHNHPSGDPSPSELDFTATKKIVQITSAMAISFIDHLIIAKGQIFSIEKGKLL